MLKFQFFIKRLRKRVWNNNDISVFHNFEPPQGVNANRLLKYY